MDIFLDVLINGKPLDFWTVHATLPNFVKVGYGDAGDFDKLAGDLGYTDKFSDTFSPAGHFWVNGQDDCLMAVPAFADPEQYA